MGAIPACVLATALCASAAPAATPRCLPQSIDVAVAHWFPADAEAKRPKLLAALYVTYAGAQSLDLYTTTIAVRRGAREVNPAVAPLTGNAPALWAVKAASTVVTIYAVERLWRRHRVGSVVVMMGANAAVGAAALHNARTARRLRSAEGARP